MRTGILSGARVALLAGPTVLAFFAGGYFATPRAWAGLVVWALVVLAALAAPSSLRLRGGGLLAVAGLALFAGWTLLSILWAPIAGNAYHAGQIAVLYVGTLLAASMRL